MKRDEERVKRTRQALTESGLDAVVVSLPTDVLLLSGYWPVTGTALAVAASDGQIGILAPEDEQSLAENGWADIVHVFSPASLHKIETLADAVRPPLARLLQEMGLGQARIGCRYGPSTEASTYAAEHLYGPAILELLGAHCAAGQPVRADEMLDRLRGVKTPTELNQIRTACRIAGMAFDEGRRHLRAGVSETEAAAAFRVPLSTQGVGFEQTRRADGFIYCMSGPDSAMASGAYARSRARRLQHGDLALIHGNSYADGFWTDITRTFFLGLPDDVTAARYDAVFAAREAAFAAIRPGVRAADVDHAARQVMEQRELGPNFKHATGHGVGYAAFDPNALPRIHPLSDDVLETGMVFNVEPAVYVNGWGGIRHCDMVAVTEGGYELLTPFLTTLNDLMLP